MRMNIQSIIQFLQSGQNPQQLAMNLIRQHLGDNPMAQNLLALAEQGQTGELEKIARNLAKQQGIDFDTEYPAFKKMLGF